MSSATIATTTSSSISVNAGWLRRLVIGTCGPRRARPRTCGASARGLYRRPDGEIDSSRAAPPALRRAIRIAAPVAIGIAFVAGIGACATTAASPEPIRQHTSRGTGRIILAGGGGEGQPGDAGAWSARLYRELLAGGDVTGDGRVVVAILAARPATEWLPDYFRWLGAADAFNVTLGSRAAADAGELDARFAGVDAVFLKGGAQSRYYDAWRGTRAERLIREVWQRGGGVGGTSAGAMILAEFALAGGGSPTSDAVLADPCGPALADEDGGSAIHCDFLHLAPHMIVDTHFSQRDRLGRVIGALARLIGETGRSDAFALGLDERTGVVLRDGAADVIGEGFAWLVRPGDAATLHLADGDSLRWKRVGVSAYSDGEELALSARTAPGCELNVSDGELRLWRERP